MPLPRNSPLSRPGSVLLLLRRFGAKLLAIIWGALMAAALSACEGSPSMLAPASRQSGAVANLFWTVTGLAVGIFILTEALLFIAVIRFRQRPGSREPIQVHGNRRLEVAWTLGPLIIVAGVFVATITTMYAVTGREAGGLPVKVIGHQWWWEIQYPDLGVTTATDFHVPVGTQVNVELSSADVIHSFWVPELAPKVDVIPGHINESTFTADAPGSFWGQCAEFCGIQHANMALQVIAEPPEDFEAWVKAQQAVAATPSGEKEALGAQIFARNACIGCHTIAGTAVRGKGGPDLTHFGSRRSIAAETVPNTRGDLMAWLADPQAVKHGVAMPNLQLSAEAIDALAAYLQGLK